MFYDFPQIKHISDVIPYVKDRKDFVIAEREWYTVINYLVEFPDSFDIDPLDPLPGIIRRESRGLMFDRDGNLISRPFHKFFNLNQRAETQIRQIDFSTSHRLLEKMDGSMIRIVYQKGSTRPIAATKMGVSEVAEQCQVWLDQQSEERLAWLWQMHLDNKTALFEWISPNNLIVVEYDHEDLVLLAIRDNLTGKYEDISTVDTPFTRVPEYGSLEHGIEEYVERARQQTGREGDIIKFDNGHMLKVKNDHYVKIHKVKDQIRSPRHIFNLMIANELDDVVGRLDSVNYDKVMSFQESFWKTFAHRQQAIVEVVNNVVEQTQGDRKRIALEVVPNLKDRTLSQFIFGSLSGKSVEDMLMDYVKKHSHADSRWNELWEWMNKDE